MARFRSESGGAARGGEVPVPVGEVVVTPTGARRAASGRWSQARRARFLEELAATGNVGLAAAACGLSTNALYRRRHLDAPFARDWDGALGLAMERLPHLLMEAAQAQFDPEAVALREGFPKVSTREALEIAKMFEGRARAKAEAGAAAPDAARVAAARSAVLERLERLQAELREEKLAAGWSEVDGQLVPPGWTRSPPE
ncbi:hypothetical protein [Sphingomicrobium aestuariivivum]|uniref:hypothetical protein n=1 Tax=Sphingomicrobium aestuariivivum TaxID=1582356 RepID=UPI001FD69275|nr:hypothetical protein [Sphingomicrobium aestuariivivum]MCJ8190710.1 hypothetical protein [Sphingomicrobium aestuariivivum]